MLGVTDSSFLQTPAAQAMLLLCLKAFSGKRIERSKKILNPLGNHCSLTAKCFLFFIITK